MKASITINISNQFDSIKAQDLMDPKQRMFPSVGRAKKLIESWPGKIKTRVHKESRTIRLYPV